MRKNYDGHLPDFWDIVERHAQANTAYILTHSVSEIADWMYIKVEDAEALKELVHSRLEVRRQYIARSGLAWRRHRKLF